MKPDRVLCEARQGSMRSQQSPLETTWVLALAKNKEEAQMCGRYHVTDETAYEMEKLIKETAEKLRWESAAALKRISSMDIHPADEAPVLLAAGGGIACTWLRWGFPVQQEQRKGLIINARCETVTDRPLFREGILHRRIAVPAASFYEWNREKAKYTFRKNDGQALFMTGCCRNYRDGEHFVILTTAANESMEPVHDRMPLLLQAEQVTEWILDAGKTEPLLRQIPFLLERSTEYEQLRFF